MAERRPEVHHAAPRCLVSLHERANGTTLDGEGIQAWLEWEWEATRWRVPVEISREELEALVESSGAVLEREAHRLVHGEDWKRWGARGGRETFRRYGADWFALLALRRWDRLTPEQLKASRLSFSCSGDAHDGPAPPRAGRRHTRGFEGAFGVRGGSFHLHRPPRHR